MRYIYNQCLCVSFAYKTPNSLHIKKSIIIFPISDNFLQARIHGAEKLMAGEQANFTCNVEFYWFDKATFIWKLGHQELFTESGKVNGYDNNTASFSSTLQRIFNLEEDKKNISCTIRMNTGDLVMEATAALGINLFCRFYCKILSTCVVWVFVCLFVCLL